MLGLRKLIASVECSCDKLFVASCVLCDFLDDFVACLFLCALNLKYAWFSPISAQKLYYICFHMQRTLHVDIDIDSHCPTLFSCVLAVYAF